jgi:hypothetical protein
MPARPPLSKPFVFEVWLHKRDKADQVVVQIIELNSEKLNTKAHANPFWFPVN